MDETETGEPTPSAAPATLAELVATIDEEVATNAAPRPEPPPARAAGAVGRVILFSLAGSRYGAPVANVVEVGKPLPTTPVPNVPGWVLGVANLRGEVLSVVDLAEYLGLGRFGGLGNLGSLGRSEDSGAAPGRMMVVRTGAEPVTSGLVVDHVTGIVPLPGSLASPTAPIDERIAPYLAGVFEAGASVVSVLDFDRLLGDPRFRHFEPAVPAAT